MYNNLGGSENELTSEVVYTCVLYHGTSTVLEVRLAKGL